jgi:7-cyano-7-deazaguanine reductase
MLSNNSLKLLGKSENRLPSSPDEAILDVFENRTPERNYTIHLIARDFSSLCPVTGQPDSAELEIYYKPGNLCVETKSLKYYLASYRNFASFNEDIVNRVLSDMLKACEPKEIIVRGRFAPRGGIQLTCEARFPESQESLKLD